MRALPDLVAFGSSSSTELGEVKTCLNPCVGCQNDCYMITEYVPRQEVDSLIVHSRGLVDHMQGLHREKAATGHRVRASHRFEAFP
jgi:hypothetical protein